MGFKPVTADYEAGGRLTQRLSRTLLYAFAGDQKWLRSGKARFGLVYTTMYKSFDTNKLPHTEIFSISSIVSWSGRTASTCTGSRAPQSSGLSPAFLVLQINRNSGCPERLTANGRKGTGFNCAPPDHP
jgi:hypothetical protein